MTHDDEVTMFERMTRELVPYGAVCDLLGQMDLLDWVADNPDFGAPR